MKSIFIFVYTFVAILFSGPSLAQTTWIVDQGGGGDYTGIQTCIDGASSGDTCEVNPGTYTETINFSGKAITVQSSAGADTTIIDGAQAGSVVTITSGESNDSRLDGFTIRNGNSTASGGGILCTYSSPTITNCTIRENSAATNGGGIFFQNHPSHNPSVTNCTIMENSAGSTGGGINCYLSSGLTVESSTISDNNSIGTGGGINCRECSPTIMGCTISGNNTGPVNGGGIYCYLGTPTIMNCTISGNGNTDTASGGGIHCYSSNPTITNCTISGNGNTQMYYGGGISCYSSYLTITNCTIFGNTAQRGGGIRCALRSPTITHCTISENTATLTDYGGGIACESSSTPTITNCILWANSTPSAPVSAEIKVVSGSPVVTYSDVQMVADEETWPGDGNTNDDPLFAGGGDYHLTESSPCIDAGTDAGVTTDRDGDTRPVGPGYDMGSDEYTSGGTLVDDRIRASSNSYSCKDTPVDPVDPCDPDLTPGFPFFDFVLELYQDYITLENISGSPLTLPIQTRLTTLTTGCSASAPPAVGSGDPGGTYWEYSASDHHTSGVAGTNFPSGEKISKLWEFVDPGGGAFSFWVEVYEGGKKEEGTILGRLGFSSGYCAKRTIEATASGDEFILDDGIAEMHTGSDTGFGIIANRFAAFSPVSLHAVSFYTSGRATGDWIEVIIYEEPTGTAFGPDPSMEVWRATTVLADGGFQEVTAAGCPLLNPGGTPGAAFYVAVANKAERSYTLGIDMSVPYAGSSYVSTDGGQTFKPLSTMPIIDGNAMIRAHVQESGFCFIGTSNRR